MQEIYCLSAYSWYQNWFILYTKLYDIVFYTLISIKKNKNEVRLIILFMIMLLLLISKIFYIWTRLFIVRQQLSSFTNRTTNRTTIRNSFPLWYYYVYLKSKQIAVHQLEQWDLVACNKEINVYSKWTKVNKQQMMQSTIW